MTAQELIRELKTIPKLIKALQEDKEAMNKSLLTSPWYSDMKVQTSNQNAQESRLVAILDKVGLYHEQVQDLLKRREKLVDFIMLISDIELRRIILAVVRSDTHDEAMANLGMYNRNKYFKLKKQAMNQLERIVRDVETGK